MINIQFTGNAPEVAGEMKLFINELARQFGDAPAAKAPTATPAVQEETPVVSDAPEVEEPEADEVRFYGKSDGGRARRTKEQMAEDAEIDELAEKLKIDVSKAVVSRPAAEVLAQLREKAEAAPEAAKASISTGDERVDPEQTEDEAPTATREDVRDAMAAYVEKRGMPAIQTNGPKLLGYKKLSEMPEDPEIFAAAVARLQEATNG